MKFFTFASLASILAVATAADDASVSPASLLPIVGQISSIVGDVTDLIQNAETIYPLIVGNSSIPVEIKDLVIEITNLSKDVGTLVHDVSSNFNTTFHINH
ncbi:hypothetical protein CANMA_001284 [Candida margitis]|uniref:uncharacterized protein n=1 Tax=Candida margitis TaxID=1775924 RepID=UPI0022274BD5|nr:uncharacterized protein CANMA_001284 [Candida margitis]KAI5969621.1 hypothetical protein CANMA_001284 [Candida margitis]